MPTISRKAKITKDICRENASATGNKSILITAVFFAIAGVSEFNDELTVAIVLLVISTAIMLYFIINHQNIKNAIERRDYYLEEDTLIKAVKRKRSNGGKVSSYNYSYRFYFTFRNNGKYKVCRSRKAVEEIIENDPEKDFADLDGEAVKYFHEGEEYYVLVLDLGRHKKIVQIFNTSLFYLDKNDFIESNGRYYPKIS